MQHDDPILTTYVDVIESLHSEWTPHFGQIKVLRAVFRDGIRSVFVQCGRKWGKTEIAAYILWRIAMTYPNAPCYFIAPLQNQAREIVWANKRLQTFGPDHWLADINNTDLRLTFTNGSFIKVDGSDNFDKYRGPEYRVCVYEEFKDHNPEFRRAMRPNAAVLRGVDVYIGSPPDTDCDYIVIAKEHAEDADKFFHQAPTWENPHIDKQWLAEEKAALYRRGEGDVWEREYGAQVVKGGQRAVFPMIHTYPTTPHDEILREISRDRHKLEWFTIADPGTTTCFAVLFVAFNPYSRTVYLLDELYETSQAETSVGKMAPRILAKQRELPQYDRDEKREVDWINVCDEAAAWFINEAGQLPKPIFFGSTRKAAVAKETGLSIIKDLLLQSKCKLSDRCEKLRWEMENYVKDGNGKIPKGNDHLIDAFRYFMQAAGYTLQEEAAPLPESARENFRGARIEDDFPEFFEDRELD